MSNPVPSRCRVAARAAALALTVLVATAALAADDPAAKPTKEKAPEPAPQADPGVITNETLEKLFGASDAPMKPVAEASDPAAKDRAARKASGTKALDPLQAMEEEKAAAARRQLAVADAEHDVAAAQANLQNLEKRILEQRNPYLPRPKLSKEEAAAEQSLDNAERVQRTQEQIELARKEVERAKAQLERARSGS